MNAAAILARAKSAGVRLEVAGDRLRLTAAAPPPPALLHEVAGAKAELLALLEGRADEAEERTAIQNEPSLPAQGTPERDRVDAAQSETLAGLLSLATEYRHRKPKGRK